MRVDKEFGNLRNECKRNMTRRCRVMEEDLSNRLYRYEGNNGRLFNFRYGISKKFNEAEEIFMGRAANRGLKQRVENLEKRIEKLSAELIQRACNMAPECSKNGIVNDSSLRRTLDHINQVLERTEEKSVITR